MIAFRAQKRLGHAQIGLLWGFNSNFPTSIPTPFVCGVPPRVSKVACHVTLTCEKINYMPLS